MNRSGMKRSGWLGTVAMLLLGVMLWMAPAWAAQKATPVPGSLSGRMDGYDWLEAEPVAQQSYCDKAYRAFRASPSQSYIISSNVQALDEVGFCKRIDQFYSYDINLEIPLDQAAATAPLLFSDHPVG